MKKIVKNSLAAIAVSSALLTGAAQAEQKIGVVDMMSIFQELPQRDAIAQSLQAEFQPKFEEMRGLETQVEELQQKLQRDASIMSDSEKEEARRELETLVSEAQLKGQALNEETRERQNQERNRLLGQVQEVINRIAADEGYDIVLQSNAVAYIKADVDLSDAVIAEMSEGQ